MTTKFSEKLKELGTCHKAIEWVGDRTEQEAWEECDRPHWMLWYVFRAKIGTKKDRILAVCACARMALKYIPAGEERPRLAIEAAERYAEEPTEENMEKVKEETKAALDAAKEASGPAASEATWAARYASRAAYEISAREAAEAASWAAARAAWASVEAAVEEASRTSEALTWRVVKGEVEIDAWKTAKLETCGIIRKKIKLKVDECGGDI